MFSREKKYASQEHQHLENNFESLVKKTNDLEKDTNNQQYFKTVSSR